jgi:hypothetical protein
MFTDFKRIIVLYIPQGGIGDFFLSFISPREGGTAGIEACFYGSRVGEMIGKKNRSEATGLRGGGNGKEAILVPRPGFRPQPGGESRDAEMGGMAAIVGVRVAGWRG